MCHLTGYIGNENAIPIIMESLRIQEAIIGAQATGLAVLKDGKINMVKDTGPIKFFEEKYNLKDYNANIGIGHTRYAIKNKTNAETNTKEKAHPFWNSDEKFVTMHNGTISNYLDFVNQLEKIGYTFRSKSEYFDHEKNEKVIDFCDSEIFSYLLEEELKRNDDMKIAIKNASKDIRGHFAFVVLHPNYPDNIFIANWMQPMHIGYSKNSSFFTSFEIGFEPTNIIFPWKFTPSKNSLITISRGKVTVEPLVEEREIPIFNYNEKLESIIFEALNNEKSDIAEIWTYISEITEKIGLSKEEYEKLSIIEGYTFTPLIYQILEKLEAENKIIRKLEYVWEGGVENTPRYKFYIK
ncbi:MAG: hypothetical protein EAX90_09040 [Candidatus Heimdallarchaeota archaeon]|nr:hypothetical protein [Candidatus Heimdallarchaeota archaeon]